jgi:hypothetical protein
MEFQQELRMMRKTADGSSWEEIIGAKTRSQGEGKNFEIEEWKVVESLNWTYFLRGWSSRPI